MFNFDNTAFNKPGASNMYGGYGTIGNAINNNVKNTEFGSIGNVANDSINNVPDYGIFGNEAKSQIDSAPKGGYNWKAFGQNLAGSFGNMGGGEQAQPNYTFNPTMASAGYVSNQFNSSPYTSSILGNPNTNLYEYLTR